MSWPVDLIPMALAQHLLNSPGQRSSTGLEPIRQATILGGERDELEAARPRGAMISGGEGGRGTSSRWSTPAAGWTSLGTATTSSKTATMGHDAERRAGENRGVSQAAPSRSERKFHGRERRLQ